VDFENILPRQINATFAVTIPPQNPAQVLLGLIFGHNLGPFNIIPNVYAPISVKLAIHIRKTHPIGPKNSLQYINEHMPKKHKINASIRNVNRPLILGENISHTISVYVPQHKITNMLYGTTKSKKTNGMKIKNDKTRAQNSFFPLPQSLHFATLFAISPFPLQEFSNNGLQIIFIKVWP
jgi:hypothetical protein